MTDKEKALAYDKLLVKAKQIYDKENDVLIMHTIEDLFPDLKESEDERIRKHLISLVKNWDKDGIASKYTSNPNDIKQILAWLEKQGEQKPFDYENANIQQNDFAPKVEPKFKVGNWYQCTKDFFGKGVTFDKNTAYYCAKEGCLQCEYGCHIAIVKNLYDNFKLWTLQDAKPGDVLAFDDNTIVIFKDLYNATTFHSYCHIEDGLFGVSKDEMPDWWEGKGFHPATKEQRDLLFSEIKEKGYEWSEETKELEEIEQNPDEHKFHEGEWVISNTVDKDYRICKITGIKDGNYTIESTCGYKGYNQFDVFDKAYRPWTIEDVKDGEVLAAKECYVIFKEITGLNIRCYCTYHYMGFSPSLSLNTLHNKAAFHPATKEESDTLGKAITNGGLKWNADKKEFTAIKPKFDVNDTIQYNGLGHNEYVIKEVHYPTHYINELGKKMDMPYTDANFTLVSHTDNRPEWWSEEDEEIINKISVAVATHYSCDTAAKVENWLKSLRSHLKQGWSKEDEVKLKSVCALIRNTSLKGNEGIEEVTIDWIKSLKDRVQSQSKQEWKQENTGDLTDFENAMMHIGESFFGQHAGLDPNDTGAVKEQANLLLGLVPKQEWSEEEKGNVDIIVSRLEVDIEYWKSRSKRRIDEDKRVIDWLKSLRSQNTWKPSKEQIIALRWVLNNVPYNKHKEEISGLLDQIKEL